MPSRRSLGGAKPLAFTEQGIAMLSSVLTSERALEVNITIMRTFVKLRQLLATHAELAHRLDALEWREGERDGKVHYVFETIQHLIEAPEPEPKRPIGFPTDQGWRVARQADSLYFSDEREEQRASSDLGQATGLGARACKAQIQALERGLDRSRRSSFAYW